MCVQVMPYCYWYHHNALGRDVSSGNTWQYCPVTGRICGEIWNKTPVQLKEVTDANMCPFKRKGIQS